MTNPTAHLNAIASLPDGWHDGDGESYAAEEIEWYRALVRRGMALGIPAPYVYPCVEGGVSLEWDGVLATANWDDRSVTVLIVETVDQFTFELGPDTPWLPDHAGEHHNRVHAAGRLLASKPILAR